jgi:hypothetical protein
MCIEVTVERTPGQRCMRLVRHGELPAASTVFNGRDGRIWSHNVYIPHRFSPDKAFTNPRYRQGVLTESFWQ